MKSQKILYGKLKNINKINIDIEYDLIHEPIPNRYIKIVKINGKTAFRSLSPEEKRYYQEKKTKQRIINPNSTQGIISFSKVKISKVKIRKKDY